MFQVKANMKLLKMGKYWVDLEWAKLLENWRFYTIAKEPLQSKVSSRTSKYVEYCIDIYVGKFQNSIHHILKID